MEEASEQSSSAAEGDADQEVVEQCDAGNDGDAPEPTGEAPSRTESLEFGCVDGRPLTPASVDEDSVPGSETKVNIRIRY
jgi:hypothetical protein